MLSTRGHPPDCLPGPGAKPHVPVGGGGNVGDIGVVRRSRAVQALLRASWGLLPPASNTAPSPVGKRGERVLECPRGRGPPLCGRRIGVGLPLTQCPFRIEEPANDGPALHPQLFLVTCTSSANAHLGVDHRSRPCGTQLPSGGRWCRAISRRAVLGCLEPQVRDTRCRSRWLDSCCPVPTDRTLGRALRPVSAVRHRHVERQNRKQTRILSAKSWKYFSHIAVKDGEEADMVVFKGNPMGDMQRSQRIQRSLPLVFDGPGAQLQGNALQTRLDGHVCQQGILRRSAGKARCARTFLDVLDRGVLVGGVPI